MKTKNVILDYQLSDVLEMNYSKKMEVIKAMKQVLLDRSIHDFNLYALSSFVLEDALVVMREGDFNQIRRLYLLDSSSETYKIYCIHALSRERGFLKNGRKHNDSLQPRRFAPA